MVLGVVVMHKIDNSRDWTEMAEMLRQAEANLLIKLGNTPVIEHPYIAAWREAYRKFGAKPKDYPSSIENLAGRVINGAAVGHINNLVCLNNTISLKHILPVGGEDLDKIVGDVLLTPAGNEDPAVFLLSEKEARAPHPGEIIYKDEAGAICRRWNWRKADRTKLTRETQNAFLVIETLPPVSRAALETAVCELADLVKQDCGGTLLTAFLDKDTRNSTSAELRPCSFAVWRLRYSSARTRNNYVSRNEKEKAIIIRSRSAGDIAVLHVGSFSRHRR